MATPLKRLRRTHPYLTPGFVPDDEDEIQKIWRLGDPLLRRPEPPPEIAPPVLTRNTDPPAPRLSDEFLQPPTLTRPRTAEMEAPPLTRERRVEPRDLLADETAYRQGMEAGGETITPLVRKPGKLATTLGILSSFLNRGIPGAAGYAINRFNPETWRNAEIDASRQREGELILQRKVGDEANQRALTTRKTLADIGLVNARTQDLQRPKPRNVQLGSAVLPDGRTVQMERDESGWKMASGPDGQPIITKPAPADKPKVVVDVPEFGNIEVTPEAALGYFGATGRERRTEERQLNREQREQQTQAEIALAAAQAARTKAETFRSTAANLENNAQYADEYEAVRLKTEAAQYRRQAYEADQDAQAQEGRAKALSSQGNAATPPVLKRNGTRTTSRGRNYVAPRVSTDRLRELMQ